MSVIDAFSTHRPFGLEELVGWCPSGERFQEPGHGANFNEYGQYLDGPADADLAYFETERIGGRIRVGGIVVPDERTGQPAVRPTGPLCAGGAVPPPTPLQLHHIPSSAEFASPAAAVRAGPESWIAVRGTLWIRQGEPTSLCGSFRSSAQDPSCDSAAVVEGLRGEELLESSQLAEITFEGLWLARVEGDHLTDLTDADGPPEKPPEAVPTGACIYVGPGKSIAKWRMAKIDLPEGVTPEGVPASPRLVTVTLTDGEEFSTGAPPPGVPVTVTMDGEWVAVAFGGEEMSCRDQPSPSSS